MTTGLRVAYLGPRGTYSEDALKRILEAVGRSDYESVPQASILDALTAVEDGSADRAVVPFENSLEGSVTATLDALSTSTDNISIVAEHDLPIDHCLVARTKLDPDQIRVVLSHPQATGQCAGYLREHLPQAEIRASASTADAVREVSERDEEWAAIGSRTAAELYGCEILAEGIDSETGNVTKFVLVAPEDESDSIEGDRWETSLVFSELGADRPGALTDALDVFSSRGINLTRIQSRPIRGDLGRYMFFLDLEGSIRDAKISDAVADLGRIADNVKILGSYPRI